MTNKFCIYVGDKNYVMHGTDNEAFFVSGMENADVYDSYKDAQEDIEKLGLDGLSNLKIVDYHKKELKCIYEREKDDYELCS